MRFSKNSYADVHPSLCGYPGSHEGCLWSPSSHRGTAFLTILTLGQPLVDTIVNYVLGVLASTTSNFANPNPFVIAAVGGNKSAPRHLPKPVAGKMTDLVMAQFGVLMPASLANISALLPLRSNFLGVELRVTAQAAPTSIYDLVLQLGSWVFYQFFSCNWSSDLDGRGVRYSLGEISVILGFGALIFLAVAIAFPSIANAALSVVGGVIVVAILVVALSLSTGWSLFCWPALPTVLFTSMAPEFILNDVAPECPILGSGLIANPEYGSFAFFIRVLSPRKSE